MTVTEACEIAQKVCIYCKEAYPNGRPENFASDPQCAFPDGVFTKDNWNCGTANRVRDLAEEHKEPGAILVRDHGIVGTDGTDHYAALVPVLSGDFLVVGWYKHRGATEYIGVFDGRSVQVATIKDIERALHPEPCEMAG